MTSLKLIIKSKLHKNKRQRHIAQLERELGITVSHVKEYNNTERKIIVGNQDNYKPYPTFEDVRSKRFERDNAYEGIEKLLHGYYFTDAGTAKDIHSKYRRYDGTLHRRYDGTLFLNWDQTEIDLLNCSFQFVNECVDKLERAGFVVNVRNMDEIKRLCPSIRFESINKT
jgi:hypothetical protein